MRLAGVFLALLLLIAGCATGPEEDARDARDASGGETTQREARDMVVEQIARGQSGPAERRVVIAGSASKLAAATGIEVPDSGEGLYVSAHAGERPTGGYRVSLSSAGGEVRVSLREPGQGDIVTQALTQPYAVAVVRTEGGGLPEAGEPRFVNAAGDPLGWPVRRVDANNG